MAKTSTKRQNIRLVSSGEGSQRTPPPSPPGPVTIFHNPRCSTSRNALARLRGMGLDPIIVDYLKTPPSALNLAELARKAGLHPREMIRTKERAFTELGRPLEELTAPAAIAAMVEHPVLLQRPIVVRGDRALIARPIERVDELLGQPAPVIPITKLRAPKAKKRPAKPSEK